MFEAKGKYNTAYIHSDSYDEKAVAQLIELCNQEFVAGASIQIMPDYHVGAGCTIGFTANLGDKVVPNLVGVDIGCGVIAAGLGKVDTGIDILARVDEIIKSRIPSGFGSHDKAQTKYEKTLNRLYCSSSVNRVDLYERQIGTLGGGNHFIEIDTDDEDNKFLVIHSGSRNLGKSVADYYQNLAVKRLRESPSQKITEIVEHHKRHGQTEKIEKAISEARKSMVKCPKDLCYLEEEDRKHYLYDMRICQEYASLNRRTMAQTILYNVFGKSLHETSCIETVHNYINFKDGIIRKGAVSAYKNELFIIPINMHEGSLLCKGKGNKKWNYSAPHGAGRLMSRSQAKAELSFEEYQAMMKDIHSTSVSRRTLDESPMAYKDIDEIIRNIQPTAEITKRIRPIYVFKAG